MVPGIKKKPFNPATFYCSYCTKPGKCAVMYFCVRGIVAKPAPSQESMRSCICVLGVSFPSLYQARKVCGHVLVCYDYVVKNSIYSNGDLDL